MVPFNTTILSQKIINKILFQTKILVQKQILVQKVFDKKNCQKNSGLKIFLVKKKYSWSEKKKFVGKFCLINKNVGPKKIYGPKKILGPEKIDAPKQIVGPKNILASKFFDPKNKFWVKKMFA